MFRRDAPPRRLAEAVEGAPLAGADRIEHGDSALSRVISRLRGPAGLPFQWEGRRYGPWASVFPTASPNLRKPPRTSHSALTHIWLRLAKPRPIERLLIRRSLVRIQPGALDRSARISCACRHTVSVGGHVRCGLAFWMGLRSSACAAIDERQPPAREHSSTAHLAGRGGLRLADVSTRPRPCE
jgi:hypothetical protein